MACDTLVLAGALKQVEVIQANDFHQMADIAKALAMYPTLTVHFPIPHSRTHLIKSYSYA